jgi:hypothetical protein
LNGTPDSSINVEVPACYADVLNVASNPLREILIRHQQVALTLDADGSWSGSLIGGEPFRVVTDVTEVDPAERSLKVPDESFRKLASLGYSLAGGVEGGRGARIHEQVFLVGEDWVLDA